MVLLFKNRIIELFDGIFDNIKDISTGKVRFFINSDKTPILQDASNDKAGFELKAEKGDIKHQFFSDNISFTILGEKYINSTFYINLFKNKILSFLDEIGIKELTRVAIRKINIINVDTIESINLAFNNELLANMLALPNIKDINKIINSITLKKDTYITNINYGLLPPIKDSNLYQIF